MIDAGSDRVLTVGTRAYIAASLVLASATVLIAVRADTPWLWVGVWAVGMALTALTASGPEWGLAGYVFVLYGTPRYSGLFDTLEQSGVLHGQVALVVLGAWLWLLRKRRPFRPDSPLVLIAAGLFAWGTLSTLAALPSMLTIDYGARHSPAFFIHAVALLFVASRVMDRPAAAKVLAGGLCAGLGVRILWQGIDGLRLEGDIGPLALMAAPLCVMVARLDDRLGLRLTMIGAALALLAAAAATYNRATAVAFAAVAVLVCWRNRRHVAWLTASLAIAVGGVAWIATTPYWTRFEDAWAELKGQAVGSVTERLDFWSAGLEIVRDNPLLGVGPSSYPYVLSTYMNRDGYVAHNSYVQVATEIGIPGLLLYALLFGAAIWTAQRAITRDAASWRRQAATEIQISLVAYLVAGLFISRHDMVLAYLLVGWLAAVTGPWGRGPVPRTPDASR